MERGIKPGDEQMNTVKFPGVILLSRESANELQQLIDDLKAEMLKVKVGADDLSFFFFFLTNLTLRYRVIHEATLLPWTNSGFSLKQHSPSFLSLFIHFLSIYLFMSMSIGVSISLCIYNTPS